MLPGPSLQRRAGRRSCTGAQRRSSGIRTPRASTSCFSVSCSGAAGASAGALWLADDAGRFVLRATGGSLAREAYPELLAPDAHARALLSSGRPWLVDGPGLWVPLAARGEGLALAQLGDAPAGFPGRGAGVHRGARRRRSGSPALVPALPRAAAPRPPGPGVVGLQPRLLHGRRDQGGGQGPALRTRVLAPQLRAGGLTALAGARRSRAGAGGGACHHPGAGAGAPRIGRAGEGGGSRSSCSCSRRPTPSVRRSSSAGRWPRPARPPSSPPWTAARRSS